MADNPLYIRDGWEIDPAAEIKRLVFAYLLSVGGLIWGFMGSYELVEIYALVWVLPFLVVVVPAWILFPFMASSRSGNTKMVLCVIICALVVASFFWIYSFVAEAETFVELFGPLVPTAGAAIFLAAKAPSLREKQ